MSAVARLAASDRACVLAIVLAGLALGAPGLGGRDLWDPDEPRTAAVTAAMVADGSWIAPRLDGRPWLEKPPLYYWLAAAASRLAGRVDEETVRLPANLASVGCAVVVFLLGRALWGRRAGLLAAIVLLTMFDFGIEARWARPDMLLGFFMTLAALAAWHALAADAPPGPRAAWGAVFWGAVGLGILSKGPVGLLPIAGVVVFAAASRRAEALGRLATAWALVGILPVAAWALAWSAEVNAPFPAAEVLARFATRLTQGVHHPRPPLHLLSTLPLALLPWAALLPAALAEIWPRRRQGARDERALFVLSLLVAYLSLFAVSVEKRGVYLLPIVPLAAVVVGRLWDVRLYPWTPPPPARAIAAGLGAWLLALAGAAAWAWWRLSEEAPALLGPAALLAVVAIGAAAAPLVLWRRTGAAGAFGVFAAGAALCSLLATHAVMPAIEPFKSARPFGGRVAAAAGADPVGIFRDPHRGIAWYAGRPLELLPSTAALAAFLSGPRRALVVAEAAAWEEAVGGAGIDARVVGRDRIGHRAFVLVEAAGVPARPVDGLGP